MPEQFRQEVARLRREHAEAREQSIRDSLTASYNRRYLDQRLLEAVDPRGEFAVALVDLDLFKRVNDTFGHLVGDRVLQQVVELLQVGLPEGAFCARYGGEEFVLMLPGLEGAAAWAVAEAARARVEQYPWSDDRARAARDGQHRRRARVRRPAGPPARTSSFGSRTGCCTRPSSRAGTPSPTVSVARSASPGRLGNDATVASSGHP